MYIPNNPDVHLQVNKKGDFVDKFTKKNIYCTERIYKYKNYNNEHKSFMIYKFKYNYINAQGRLVKIEKIFENYIITRYHILVKKLIKCVI